MHEMTKWQDPVKTYYIPSCWAGVRAEAAMMASGKDLIMMMLMMMMGMVIVRIMMMLMTMMMMMMR